MTKKKTEATDETTAPANGGKSAKKTAKRTTEPKTANEAILSAWRYDSKTKAETTKGKKPAKSVTPKAEKPRRKRLEEMTLEELTLLVWDKAYKNRHKRLDLSGEGGTAMTVLEQLLEKARSLNPEQQRELLEHAERLEQDTQTPAERESLWGACAGEGEDLSLEEFQQLRREMWANFPRDIEP